MSMRQKPFIIVDEVARMLNCKTTTVYSWAKSGVLPSYKIRGLVRFDPEEVEQWIQSQKIEPRKATSRSHPGKGSMNSLRDVDSIIRRAIDTTVAKEKASGI